MSTYEILAIVLGTPATLVGIWSFIRVAIDVGTIKGQLITRVDHVEDRLDAHDERLAICDEGIHDVELELARGASGSS